jgi:hypothetical protein
MHLNKESAAGLEQEENLIPVWCFCQETPLLRKILIKIK